MALFNSEEERKRKENLRLLEDKRLRFVELCERENFRPERMLFISREDGSFVALARQSEALAMVVSPRFAGEGEFMLELLSEPKFEREDFYEPGTGMNGIMGFGTKSARGFNLTIMDSSDLPVLVPVIAGRNSWMEANYKKNPLLKPKRRRGDANVVWELMPITPGDVGRIAALIDEYYLK